MADKITLELEHVTQIVLAPPNLVTSEQRQVAENVILEFRKTKMPYNTCRHILENSKCDYVLFQAATTIKESIIREWSLLSAEDIESLRSFLLRFITQNITLQSYVREQILQTVAVILKRGTLDTKGASRDTLFGDVTQLVSSGNVTMQLVACSMLTALLNEYSSSSRTSSVGFTWEFHSRCKRSFEESDLKRVFLFALQVLNELEKQSSPLPREATAVLNRMLSIAEQVLCWEFTPKAFYRRHVGSFEMNQNIPLKPNERWRDTLVDKAVLQLFFKIHKKVRHNSEMAHHSMQCLTQLASLNGTVFPDDKARSEYLHTYMDNFLQLLTSIDLQDYENLGVANMFKNLVMMFPVSCLLSIPEDMFNLFLEQLTHRTCDTGRAAALEEAIHKDDTIYMEAYEKMLETWMELVSNMKDVSMDKLKPKVLEVFNTYMQCHVSAPEGTRTQEGMDSRNDDTEIDEIEEDDRDRFSDQLCSIGILGRMVPDHSIHSLCRILEDRVTRLHSQLQRLQQQECIDTGQPLDPHLTVLYEDLHWILLIATHVLMEEAEGETPMIPSDIMEYSINQSKSVDIQTTLKVLASPGERAEAIPGSDQSTDFVVRLISAVFRLCEVEKRAIEASMTCILSPQVSGSAMLFLKRWSVAYLLPDENYYSQVSPALMSSFGRDTEGAQWTVSFLLDKIISNLSAWTAEEKLLCDTVKLLVSMVDNRARIVFVTKCNLLWKLAKLEAEHKPPLSLLPFSAKRLLLRALVVVGMGVEANWREEYWNCVLKSIHDRFYKTVCQEKLGTMHLQTMKDRIVDLLECLCGVAEGTRLDNLKKLFAFLHPLLTDCIKILDIFHGFEDIVPLVLELFSVVVSKQLCYLGESDSVKLYELTLSAIQTYSKHNTGRRFTNSSEEEEDHYNDVLIMMELLTELLSKDFIDFGEPEEGVPQGGGQIEAADVVLYGLNTIVPLMNADLLKFPSLCSQYFKLVAFLAEIHPEKFPSLPEELYKNLAASVELGLTSYGSDITKLSLEILTALASYVFQENQPGSQIHTSLSHFLKIVFHMLLLETFNMDLLETASTSLFCLICCHQDDYRELVNQLLQNQLDLSYKERLLEAFNNLTPHSLSMTINRQNKIAFMKNFDQFLINVRGFLCVK